MPEVPAEAARLVADLGKQVTQLQAWLSGQTSVGHALLRGTAEAALAEVQGAKIPKPDGGFYKHFINLENSLNALNGQRAEVARLLRQLRELDPAKGRELGEAFEPLLRMVRSRADLARRTLALVREIRITNHVGRLAGEVLQRGGRTVSGAAGTQLRNLLGPLRRGVELVPRGLAPFRWVRDTLVEIRRLPVDEEAAAAEAAAATAAARSGLRAVVARGVGPLSRLMASALEAILAGVTRPLLLFIITDRYGNPIGLQLPGQPPRQDGI